MLGRGYVVYRVIYLYYFGLKVEYICELYFNFGVDFKVIFE